MPRSTPEPTGLTRRTTLWASGTAAVLLATAECAVAVDVAAPGRRKTIGIQVGSVSFVDAGIDPGWRPGHDRLELRMTDTGEPAQGGD